jgi:outer membrane protein TolC
LDRVLQIVLERNPDLLEARARLRAQLAGVPAASRLPDLEFKYELWGQPLSDPVSFGKAQTHMFGLRQAIPAPGSLEARRRVALADAQTGLDALHAHTQDVAEQVRKAFATYYQSDREYAVHLEHVTLTSRIVELARANYRAGRATQQDVLRTLVALSQLWPGEKNVSSPSTRICRKERQTMFANRRPDPHAAWTVRP